MSRLDSSRTAELWGRSQRYVRAKANTVCALEFYKLGLAHMKMHKKKILFGITMSDLYGNHYLLNLHEDIGKTMDYYRKRIADWEE